MTAQTLASALHAQRSGRHFRTYCPVHEWDGRKHRPSLEISEGKRVPILVRCWAGCTQSAIIGKLKAANLWPMTPPVAPHIRREYAREQAEREERILELVDLIDSFDHLKLRAKPWSYTWIALCIEQREMRREIEELRNADRQPLLAKRATA